MNWSTRKTREAIPKWLELMETNEAIKRKVTVCEEIYYDEENSYGAYVCKEDPKKTFRISGSFPFALQDGQSYHVEGNVILYKESKQIKVHTITIEKPSTPEGVIVFLQSLKGLKKRALVLYETYGLEVIDILQRDPLRISKEIPGIGQRLVESWSKQIKLLDGNYDVLARLMNWGMTLHQAKKLMLEFKHEVEEVIGRNPYILNRRVKGFGFWRCDQIARQNGFDLKAKSRKLAAIRYVLREASQDGHCFLMREELLNRVKETLDIQLTADEMKQLLAQFNGQSTISYTLSSLIYELDYKAVLEHYERYLAENNLQLKRQHRYTVLAFDKADIDSEVQRLLDRTKLVEAEGRVYLAEVYEAELIVAARILKIMLHPTIPFSQAASDIQPYLKAHQLQLEAKQAEAATLFSEQSGGMYILNGSAGCGKTFTLKVILELLEIQYQKMNLPFRVKVFAPTGKASKVAAKATGRECTTIHRGLGYKAEGGFEFNERQPLPIDCLVLDESSMLDIVLAKHLFNAIPPHCKVIFMGDTKQLPSVGAGNVLHDLINSGVIPVITLDVVKRQGKDSGIIYNANKIINGDMIASTPETKDAYIIEHNGTELVQTTILKSISRLLQTRDYTIEDIQVLCPQRKGEVGTYVMNWLIQQAFNGQEDVEKVENRKIAKKKSGSDEVEEVTLYFKPGDKVIHIANNYQMKWYNKTNANVLEENTRLVGITNGECGVIEEIYAVDGQNDEQEHVIVVRYEDGYVKYANEFDELDHCYAMTIHKSQGSQWPAVLMVVMLENYNMLDNSIFYTGYTRAKEFNCVIGQPKAIAHAISTFKHRKRNTSLNEKFIASNDGQ